MTLGIGASVGGCGVDFAYLIPAATGQLDIIFNAVPIDDAIATGDLSDETVQKLRLVQDVRDFARDTIGLNAGQHYTTFYDAHGEAVAYNLSASRKDRFQPFIWTFPFVGSVPYLGFFDADAVFARRDELVAEGYDVFIYEIDAYYALGIYPNPVLSPMLKRSEESLIDTVIHELVHATIIRLDDTPFNESLATYIGRTGAVEYLDDRFADQPERRAIAIARFEDSDRYAAFILSLYNDLDAYYTSDLSSAAKIAGRAAVYEAGRERFAAEVLPQMNLPDNYSWVESLPVNNAFMLGVRRYNLDLDAFRQESPYEEGEPYHGIHNRCVQLRLVNGREQVAYLSSLHMEAHIAEGDAIQVGTSRKFESEDIAKLARLAGLELRRQWRDERGYFSLNEFVCGG